MMFNWLFWHPRKAIAKTVQEVQEVQEVQASRPMMDDETLGTTLTTLHDCWWNLKDSLGVSMSFIPPVQVTTKFCGWGYVVGRTRAFNVNARLAVCEADDDMGFTKYCVLMDGVPSLLITRRYQGVSVTIITERDFVADVLNTAAMPMNSIADFRRMPEPVQRVMNDVLAKFHAHRLAFLEKKIDTNPIEKMLDYK